MRYELSSVGWNLGDADSDSDYSLSFSQHEIKLYLFNYSNLNLSAVRRRAQKKKVRKNRGNEEVSAGHNRCCLFAVTVLQCQPREKVFAANVSSLCQQQFMVSTWVKLAVRQNSISTKKRLRRELLLTERGVLCCKHFLSQLALTSSQTASI